MFKKFKSQQEAQNFVDGAPAAKKTKFAQKINLSGTINKILSTKSKETSDASLDAAFESFPEYPDDPSTSDSQQPTKPQKNKKPDKMSTTTNKSLKKLQTKSNQSKSLGIPFEPPEPTVVKIYNGLQFNEDSKGFVHVYTDGSCAGNGKKLAAAGIGVYFGENHELNVAEPVEGRPTNNVGEIQAAVRAIQDAQKSGVKRLNIFTDSQFTIKSVCLWMQKWKKKDWKKASGQPVANQTDFKRLDELIESGDMLIKWSYIPAHKGYDGNEEADKLAKLGASLYRNNKDPCK